MVPIVVYISLVVAVFVSFWTSLVEATYLTLRPFSLSASIGKSSGRASTALAIVSEKTKLVSVTTFLDTTANVVLATAMGLILANAFGPIGWIYSAVIGSFVIMILLYLLPKAIGIENALRMSLMLAASTKAAMAVLSPVTVPLGNLARTLSEMLVGKPGYKKMDLASEFEDVVTMLEKSGHIEPDAGRLLRTALASSRMDAIDAATPVNEIISVDSDATILDALKAMGESSHPRLPVFDAQRKMYIGAVTMKTLSKAVSQEPIDSRIHNYVIQPARVSRDDGLATVIEKMQDAATTIAFVFDDDNFAGVITLSDILERILGVKV